MFKDLNPSGQNVDLSGDTVHNNTISIKVNEMEPSGQNMDRSGDTIPNDTINIEEDEMKSSDRQRSQEIFETELESLQNGTPNQSLSKDITYTTRSAI